MSKKFKKSQINTVVSMTANHYEQIIKEICKEQNIYYPPKKLVSLRGTKRFDYLCEE